MILRCHILMFAALISSAFPIEDGKDQALSLSIPFEFQNNQIFLQVGINDASPMWFILDSGASGCVIDADVARRLGLKTEGESRSTGAGKGTVKVTFTKDVAYKLPRVSFSVPTSYVIDLSGQLTLQGRQVAGILGYDFFTRFVVDIDYEARVLTLYDPETFVYAGSGTVVPFALKRKTPYVKIRVKVSGHESEQREVLVDSGSGDAVDSDALALSPQKIEVLGGVGLGQEFRTVFSRGEEAQIGPFVLEKPIGATGGVELIGTEVLRRFDVVFDYRHNQIILAPNSHLCDAFVFDASGLDLRWTPDLKGFVVHDVASQSPASEADLKIGDVITAINGQLAAEFTIEQFQAMLTRPGKELRFGILRESKLMERKLRLRQRL